MPSPDPSEVWVEAVGVGRFDRFTSFSIAHDVTAPSEAGFEVGDDGSWKELERFIKHGTEYKVYIGRSLRMTGRVILNDVPVDTGGAVVRFTVRTKLADAMYASANPNIKVGGGATVKDFLLAIYEPLGYTEDDFIFDADVGRNLLTGVHGTSGKSAVTFESLTEDKAKINPPETLYVAADRHLRRFGLMHWDSGDGRIIVGAPDDTQLPLYKFRMYNDARGASNNLLSVQRTKDWSDAASIVGVFGRAGSWNISSIPTRGFAQDDDLLTAGFYRPVIVQSDGIASKAMAEAQARREMSARRKGKESWTLTTDGFAHWDGHALIGYSIDTVADVECSVAGGPTGAYYLHRVEFRRDAGGGDVTNLYAVGKGVWVL